MKSSIECKKIHDKFPLFKEGDPAKLVGGFKKLEARKWTDHIENLNDKIQNPNVKGMTKSKCQKE
jgi:hypothetical protein